MENEDIEARARAAGIVHVDAFAKRRLRVIQGTSPSQIENWDTCPRYWWFKSVEGVQEKRRGHLVRGTHIDLEVQHYFGTGEIRHKVVSVERGDREGEYRDEEWSHLIAEVARHLPRPHPGVKTQMVLRAPTFEGGPSMIMKPDFMYEVEPWWLQIDDLKSISDFMRCKTKEQLAQNTQLICYTRAGYEVLGAKRVTINHVYGRTKRDYKKADGKAPPRAHRSFRPHAYVDDDNKCECTECKNWLSRANRGLELPTERLEIPRAAADAVWNAAILPSVREMVEAAKLARSAHDLPPSTEYCANMYGYPCPNLERCGIDPLTINSRGKRMSGPTNGQPSLMDILNQHNAAQGQPAQSWPPPGQGQGSPGSIIPGAVTGGYVPTQPTQAPAVPVMAIPQPAQPATAPGYNPNHAHPGTVLPADAGYRPGQPCNGNGHYASANGQGFIPVEPGHACPVCRPAMVVPPDAPARTSTLQEIQAVEEGKKKRGRKPKAADPAEMLKIYSELNEKRGFTLNEVERLFKENAVEDALSGKITPGMMRQPTPAQATPAPAQPAPTLTNATTMPEQAKAAQDSWYANSGPASQAQQPAPQAQQSASPSPTSFNVIEQDRALSQAAPPTTVVNNFVTTQPPAVTSNPDPDGLRRAAQERVDQYVAQRRQRPLKLPPTPPVILVDCPVTKATGAFAFMSGAVNLADWIAPVAELAAKAAVDENGKPAPVDDWRLVPYGRGRGILAAAIRECLDSLPAVVLVDSAMSGADAFLECVAPHAALIVRGLK